jgi:tRNA threonylcarbamoyladenosine biosynthesis protein TsaB
MAYILSIETSAPICSVALHEDGKLKGVSEVAVENSHSEVLTVLILNLLKNTFVDKSQLDAIAISEGPGSYTGLRIGMSTAKGLCYALEIPLVAVQTLKAMSKQVQIHHSITEDILYCPMLDARRMEVYHAIYDNNLVEVQETKPLIFEEGVLAGYTDKKVLYFGNGAAKGQEVLNNENFHFIAGIETSALGMGELAFDKFEKEIFEDVAYCEPFYLKDVRITVSKKKYL